MNISDNKFNSTFDKYIDTCIKLFNINKQELFTTSSKRRISDIKKIIILKFYKDKINNRDNVVNLLANKFKCYHSNIVYLHNTAQILYDVDSKFKINFDLFESTFNKL